jgi:hypothetical protein
MIISKETLQLSQPLSIKAPLKKKAIKYLNLTRRRLSKKKANYK